MALRTRYLQISDIMMFEYSMLGQDDVVEETRPVSFIYTKLKDGHYLLFSPVSYECERKLNTETGNYYYKKRNEPLSINTLNHLAVPKDSQDSLYYYFIDPDYEYVDDSIMDRIYYNQIKARNYDDYLINPIDPNGGPLEMSYTSLTDLRFDTAKIYFVNGYDFSNVYGVYIRISVDGGSSRYSDDKIVDLCDLFITKSTFYKLIKYSINPTMFGNNIYDRYIEINIACLYDLIKGKTAHDEYDIYKELNIKDNTNLRLSFAYITEEDVEIKELDLDINDQLNGGSALNNNVNLTFTRSSILNGTIPSSNINSDYLGAYIAECPDLPYLMFYATWRDKPLTKQIVWQFNKGIILYDRSLIKDDYDYEVGDDYEVKHDFSKWLCMHDIKCSFCMGEHIVKTETYSMTQSFINDSDPEIFYYRPTIFDEAEGYFIDNVQIVYTMRFINSHDKVQFVKVASMSLSKNISKFYIKGTTLKTSSLTPYKIYNKIIENKQENVINGNGINKTKYVKVFYNSTDIVLDNNGTTVSGEYNYTQTISQAPKTYKFVFKKMAPNGTYSYMDLSNGYYKLLFKDAEMNDNLIDPTYSTNMNLYVGELEFNLSQTMVNKMNNVLESDRKMSIVAYNEDGSVSSMFDMMYTI